MIVRTGLTVVKRDAPRRVRLVLMNLPNPIRALLVASCVVAAQPLWADDSPARTVPMEREFGADRFVAGCPVSVARAVAGDLIAAGCHVDVLAAVDGDLVVVGGNLRVAAPVKQGVYAAGGRVSIDGVVRRNIRVAGGTLELGPAAKIAGNVTAAGGSVQIRGAVGGYLQVAGGSVLLDGPVAGDVEVGAGELELGPGAAIEGKLRYASRKEIRRDPAAQVRGGIEHVEGGAGWPALRPRAEHRKHGSGWVWSVGLLMIAAILVAALPAQSLGVAQTVRTRWAPAMLVGFIALACVPVAVLIAMVTVIGIPLALVAIALYGALLVVGYVSSGIALGIVALQHWRTDRAALPGWRIGAAVLAMALISLLGRLPFVGWLFTLAAMLTGIGAMLLQWRASIRAAAPAGRDAA